MNEIYTVIWIGALLISHEIGHAFMGKKEGKFQSFGLLPTPHVKLTEPFNNGLGYAAGFLFSLPIAVLYTQPIYGVLISAGGCIGDLIAWIAKKKIEKENE